MLKPIFVDTGFVIGLINDQDDHHDEAVLLAERYEGYPFVTTDAVLLEVGNAPAKRFRAVGWAERLFAKPNINGKAV